MLVSPSATARSDGNDANLGNVGRCCVAPVCAFVVVVVVVVVVCCVCCCSACVVVAVVGGVVEVELG